MRAQVIFTILIPAALPEIFESFRVMNAIAWTYVILAEAVNPGTSLGYLIQLAYTHSKPAWSFAGLFVIGEANFSDHGANRLGASALMQGLADGYFVLPATLPNYLAGMLGTAAPDANSQEFKDVEAEVRDLLGKIDLQGGAVACIASGWFAEELERNAFADQRRVEAGGFIGGGKDRAVERLHLVAQAGERLRGVGGERAFARAIVGDAAARLVQFAHPARGGGALRGSYSRASSVISIVRSSPARSRVTRM